MVTEHKAFVFDYITFIQEVAKVLENALSCNKSNELIIFIENNLQSLKDPYEGEPLDSLWKEMIETEDISQYGDFAITKYYNPKSDIGLGYNWDLLNDALLNQLDTDLSPLLGLPFGSDPNYFDPGKLGSYFQSSEQVRKNLELISSFTKEKNILPNIVFLEEMLFNAFTLGKGLYITF